MIYHLDLATTSLIAGLFLIVLGGLALLRPVAADSFLQTFPRSKMAGFILLSVAALWAWLLISQIDLGEFSNWRTRILVLIPIAYVLTLKYVDEFLAVRALGMVALLAGEPMLESAWLRPENSRLLLVVFAYAAIIFGMFWIGMPFTLRNQASWLRQGHGRLKPVAIGVLVYGLALLSLGLTLHRPA